MKLIQLFFQFLHIVLCTVGVHYYNSLYGTCLYCPHEGTPIIKGIVRWSLDHGGNIFQLALILGIWGGMVREYGAIEGSAYLFIGVPSLLIGGAIGLTLFGVAVYYILKTSWDLFTSIRDGLRAWANRV